MRSSRWRPLRALSPLLVAVLVVAPAAAAAPGPAANPLAKADRQVVDQLTRAGRVSFFAILRDRADLSQAGDLRRHGQRTAFGYQRLTATADRSQVGLRALLRGSRARFQPFWIVNTILVRDADRSLLEDIARRPEVARIRAVGSRHIETPRPARAVAAVNGVEWGIDRIHAPDVWSTFGNRGEGIVVASIDTGVQFDHPALVRQYRGNLGNSQFDHNYNWFDPSSVCGRPSLVPCDNHGHGTHTMGTMVGDDGQGNQIGVAPGAKWIAAKGCESASCSDAALLAAGQWVIAPTDLNGQNPRPDLAPHIVNNSWGGNGGDPFYQEIVNRWVDVGIFPVFANGNSGSSCRSAGSPGDYLNTYSAGAFDSNGQIASFSSRGPSSFGGETKPNIAAPGVAVRSSVPPNSYTSFSGTSMATPHVAGAVALLWSAAPSLIGDIARTRQLLDQGAVDTDDESCGGTAADNDVWGEGQLNAFATVERSPRVPAGTLRGTVTDAATGQAVQDAKVHVVGAGDLQGNTTTNSSGVFTLVLPAGGYQLSAGHFGYATGSATVDVVGGQTTTQDLRLSALPRHTLTGQVRDDGGISVADATVTLANTPLPPVSSGGDGTFRIDGVPSGEYDLSVAPVRCVTGGVQHVVVNGDTSATVSLPPRRDGFGYQCRAQSLAWIGGTDAMPLTGDDGLASVALPFSFSFYGHNYTTAYVSTNGFVSFIKPPSSLPNNLPLPNNLVPKAAICALWDDLVVDGAASVQTALVGQAPQRQFVVEWRNVGFFGASSRATFEVVLNEDGRVLLQYKDLSDDDPAHGGSATTGIQNEDATVALQYSSGLPLLRPGTAAVFGPPGTVHGTVADAGNGQRLAGATVRALRGGVGDAIATTLTDAQGAYLLRLPPGSYRIEASKSRYFTATAQVTVVGDGDLTQDFSLAPAHVISGHVRDSAGNPVADAPIILDGSPTPATTTGADGAYTLSAVSTGDHTLFSSAIRCVNGSDTQHVTVDTDKTVDFTVSRRSSKFGYQCWDLSASYIDGTTTLPLSGDDTAAQVALPFAFPFYGKSYTTAYVATNGFLNFLGPQTTHNNYTIPFPDVPNAAVYPLWDDLVVDGSASVRTALVGQAPQRRFAVEWRNVAFVGTDLRVTFEAVLSEDGHVVLQYKDIPGDGRARGNSATIGIENEDGSAGFRYAWNSAVLRPGTAISLSVPGKVQGKVTDARSGQPLQGATVQATSNGTTVASAQTDAAGAYTLGLPLGTFTVQASKSEYTPAAASASIAADGDVVTDNFALVSNVVSGHVRDDAGNPVAFAPVSMTGGATMTGTDGSYRLAGLPAGSNTLAVSATGCTGGASVPVTVNGNQTVDVTVTRKRDTFGYGCRTLGATWVDGANAAPLSGDDAAAAVALPFPVPFYGQSYTTAYVSTNGFLNFLGPQAGPAVAWVPNTNPPNGAVYGLSDDLVVDGSASVRTAVVGQAPTRQFVVEWRNVLVKSSQARVTFEVVLYEDGRVLLQYRDLPSGGVVAIAGIENQAGTVAIQYIPASVVRLLWLRPGMAILFTPPGGAQAAAAADARRQA
jgi:subtilisin family serine protease